MVSIVWVFADVDGTDKQLSCSSCILDHYVGGEIPHALEDKGEIGEQYVSMFYFEVIIRRLLTMRTPDAPAVRVRFLLN